LVLMQNEGKPGEVNVKEILVLLTKEAGCLPYCIHPSITTWPKWTTSTVTVTRVGKPEEEVTKRESNCLLTSIISIVW